MAAPHSRFRLSRRWQRILSLGGWSALGLLGATFLVYMLTVTFGAVHGVEFCPQTFERRSYSFYELPLVGIQVTGLRHDDVSSVAETALTSQKMIAPPGGNQDWHIVVGSRGARLLRKGDAAILMQYLDAQDAANNYRWIEWTNDHAALAKLLWPAVQRLAVHELYVFVPDLFDLAKRVQDPAKLKTAIDAATAQHLRFLADRLRQRGEETAAAAVLKEAGGLDSKPAENVKAGP